MGKAFQSVAVRILLTIAALASAGAAAAAQPVTIGISLGLTGQYSIPSEMQKRAYELWRDEVNARGGLLGRPIQLVVRDDRSDPSLALRIYSEFVQNKSVDHVFGPYSSELTAAVAPVVEKAGFPMLAAGAAADEIWTQG